jgi:hypothetical protein
VGKEKQPEKKLCSGVPRDLVEALLGKAITEATEVVGKAKTSKSEEKN